MKNQSHSTEKTKIAEPDSKDKMNIDLTMVESRYKRNLPYNNEKGVREIRKNDYKGDNGKDEKYLANLFQKDQFSYVGTLNENLQRNGVGLYKYSCGDTYFGQWKVDNRDKIGVYAHKSENDQSEFYAGNWKETTRDGFGIYVWRKDTPAKDKIIMDIFIGNFSKGDLSNGLYISRKLEEDNTVSKFYYLGKFVKGVKEDENCLYYLTNSDILFKGQIKDDDVIKGKIYQGNDKRAFSFEKHQKEYYPDEIPEEEQPKLEDLYNSFKKFDEKLDAKAKFTGLVEKIEEFIIMYSDLRKFNENIDISSELKMSDYQNMVKELFKFNEISIDFNEKDREEPQEQNQKEPQEQNQKEPGEQNHKEPKEQNHKEPQEQNQKEPQEQNQKEPQEEPQQPAKSTSSNGIQTNNQVNNVNSEKSEKITKPTENNKIEINNDIAITKNDSDSSENKNSSNQDLKSNSEKSKKQKINENSKQADENQHGDQSVKNNETSNDNNSLDDSSQGSPNITISKNAKKRLQRKASQINQAADTEK